MTVYINMLRSFLIQQIKSNIVRNEYEGMCANYGTDAKSLTLYFS